MRIYVRNWTADKIQALVDAHPDGFTADIKTGELLSKGYAVGMTHGLSLEDAAVVANLVDKIDKIPSVVNCWTVGGWKDNQTGEYIVDIGFVTRYQEGAMSLGRAYNQKAIYDMTAQKCIDL
jgi:hypothetical protein